jgi:hypothetical protein
VVTDPDVLESYRRDRTVWVDAGRLRQRCCRRPPPQVATAVRIAADA